MAGIGVSIAAGLLLASTADASANGRAKASAKSGGHQLIAALGDSITAGYPDYEPNPALRLPGQPARTNPRSQWEYWARRKHPELRFRNCGVAGERTDEMALRLASCIQGADSVVIEGGLNDIGQGISAEVAGANLLAMVRAVKGLGLDVAIADATPWSRWHPWFDSTVTALNDQIHRIAQQENVTLLPFYSTLEDPNQPGAVPAGWLSWDNSHPSVAGYRRLGELAFRLPSGGAATRAAKARATKARGARSANGR